MAPLLVFGGGAPCIFDEHARKIRRVVNAHQRAHLIYFAVVFSQQLFCHLNTVEVDGISNGVSGLFFINPAQVTAVDKQLCADILQGDAGCIILQNVLVYIADERAFANQLLAASIRHGFYGFSANFQQAEQGFYRINLLVKGLFLLMIIASKILLHHFAQQGGANN